MNDYLELLSIDEVCEILHVGRNTITALLVSGQLKGFRVGSRVWKIPKTAVNDYIYQQLNSTK